MKLTYYTGLFYLFFLCVKPCVFSQGNVVRIENFQSKFIEQRNIDVWLPSDYDSIKKYAVVYMHDGQMLFDSTQTWNGLSWNLDPMAHQLSKQQNSKPFILVGIWNDPNTRHSEYFPTKPFKYLNKVQKDTLIHQLQHAGRANQTFVPRGDDYLKFLVHELMPYILKKYSVSNRKEDTFIGGSSMGGLISIYAGCEYPRQFGGVFCLSTHWPGSFTLDNNPFPKSMLQYIERKMHRLRKTKIYFDCGDQTLDALYPALQKEVNLAFQHKKSKHSDFLSLSFPGEEHSEKAWAKRIDQPLRFLLKH